MQTSGKHGAPLRREDGCRGSTVRQRGLPSTTLDHALILALRPEAARRGTTVLRLIHDLLDTIAADKLTAAILDQWA